MQLFFYKHHILKKISIMKIVTNPQELALELKQVKAEGKKIGLVPTMGALHAGHKSLVKRAVDENDYIVVSVFVNPTQFNNQEDLQKYPRNLEKDAQLLASAGCNLIFAPKSEDIYSEAEMSKPFEFDFGGLDQVMEGKYRPGHFNGVVQIVSKLFAYVQPDRAYFGEKDFQQLAIIHRMVKVMNLPVQIVDCPIVREATGLALSSRNERLSEDQRKYAVKISEVLFESRNFAPQKSVAEITDYVIAKVNEQKYLEVEYYEIVNADTLQPVQSWNEPAVGCITVYCGDVRLIDNIRY